MHGTRRFPHPIFICAFYSGKGGFCFLPDDRTVKIILTMTGRRRAAEIKCNTPVGNTKTDTAKAVPNAIIRSAVFAEAYAEKAVISYGV